MADSQDVETPNELPKIKRKRGRPPKKLASQSASPLLIDRAPAEWADKLSSHLDEVHWIRLDVRLGSGKPRAYKQLTCSHAADTDGQGELCVYFDGSPLSVVDTVGSCWAMGNDFLAKDNARREEQRQQPISQCGLIMQILDKKGAILCTCDEKVKLDEYGVAFSDKTESSTEKIALAMVANLERETRRLRGELTDAQCEIRDRDSNFANTANTFVTMLGNHSDERMKMLDQMTAMGVGYESPEKIAVYNRLVGVAELIGEGFADEGMGFFASPDGSKKDKDDEAAKDNKFQKPLDAISEEGWEVILDLTHITEEELELAKENFLKMGKRSVPTTQQALMAGSMMGIINDNFDDITEDLPRKDLKHFKRIAKLVQGKLKRKERRDSRDAERQKRKEQKANEAAAAAE